MAPDLAPARRRPPSGAEGGGDGQGWRPAPGPGGARGPALALFARDLGGGGVQRAMLRLAVGLAGLGRAVDLVVCRAEGPLLAEVPPAVRLVALEPGPRRLARLLPLLADPGGAAALLPALLPDLLAKRLPSPSLPYVASLARYLRRERPAALVSGITQPNLEAVWARRLARTETPLVLTEHVHFTAALADSSPWRRRHLPGLVRRTYPLADAVVAVSAGLADDLAAACGLERGLRLRVIPNPVVGPELARLAAEPPGHPWLRPGQPPVVLGAGRLSAQKDFPTLVRAFALARAARPLRLVILGEADGAGGAAERAALLALAAALGVGPAVDLPGYVANPYAHMARAGVFALSSAFEGFGNVLVEALACGCPVVSTDCPSGPAEILQGGRHGALVPVGDHDALAGAILATLDRPGDRAGRVRRAAAFSVEAAAGRYLELLAGLPARAAATGRSVAAA